MYIERHNDKPSGVCLTVNEGSGFRLDDYNGYYPAAMKKALEESEALPMTEIMRAAHKHDELTLYTIRSSRSVSSCYRLEFEQDKFSIWSCQVPMTIEVTLDTAQKRGEIARFKTKFSVFINDLRQELEEYVL
jgi:hypothetical protein